LNKGIATFLQGDVESAKQCLRNALQKLREAGSKYFADAAFVLLLGSGLKTATAYPNLLVEVAILINQWRVGDLPRPELEVELMRLIPEKSKALLDALAQG
jgi:hypothetical protein